MTDIVPPLTADNQKLFQELCRIRVLRFAARELDLHDAVDWLQHWAVNTGLIRDIGQDAVQAIMANAFRPHRKDLELRAEGDDAMTFEQLYRKLNDRRRFPHAPQSTCDALAWSLIHNNGWNRAKSKAANLTRLEQLSDRQLGDLIAALKKHNCPAALIAEIESLI